MEIFLISIGIRCGFYDMDALSDLINSLSVLQLSIPFLLFFSDKKSSVYSFGM
jgi:hypothetical protein